MQRYITISLALLLAGATLLSARTLPNKKPLAPRASSALPQSCTAEHALGQIAVSISNYGTWGDGVLLDQIDCFTGLDVNSCLFPKTNPTEYLFFGTLWVGAVMGTDTLVSVGHDGWQWAKEFYPDPSPGGDIVYRSIISPIPSEQIDAVSEQDFVAVYRDTVTAEDSYLIPDVIDGRPHIPLPVEITEESYAWSDTIAEDFVIFNCRVKNIGTQTLQDMYIGIHIDGDIYLPPDFTGIDDDITGFRTVTMSVPCGAAPDTLPLGWIADNDGQLSDPTKQASAIGTVLISKPVGAETFSYHWWYSTPEASLDFGPMLTANLRDFSTGGSGTPEGDRNKYYLMRTGEIDYDQVFTSSLAGDPSWVAPPPDLGDTLSDGADTRYLMSFGPIDLAPGATAPFVFALVGGENLHQVSGNLANLPSNPNAYQANLDFTDLEKNALAAFWLYDNPGVDSDSDGYAGQFEVCDGDTVYTSGDGVPDYKPFVPAVKCCVGSRGNINASSNQLIDLSDLSLLVAYLVVPAPGKPELPCFDEANVSGAGIIDLTDLSTLVLYLTVPAPNKPVLPNCP